MTYLSTYLRRQVLFYIFKFADGSLLLTLYVVHTLVSRMTNPVRLFFPRKKFPASMYILFYSLLMKIPCAFLYFWTFMPCCTLIREIGYSGHWMYVF